LLFEWGFEILELWVIIRSRHGQLEVLEDLIAGSFDDPI